ncbi:MAG TPA: proline iminopeptidase-family hydrolase [Anaeromyxobacteraceae bacterium]|nr:proline iminopeptidase-family hydrolase [Anaeromyxobacteraceae bacterium]
MPRAAALLLVLPLLPALARPADASPAAVYPMEEGWVDAGGVLQYYKMVGRGPPLVILHGGPGASHEYFLPWLLPLARSHRLVFLDQRGSGKSEKLDDPKRYTIEAMVEDLEAARKALRLGRVDLLGHSCGGVLAQAYALRYQQNVKRLVLASTFASTKGLNAVFARMKERMAPELRQRIEAAEKKGLFGQGKPFERGRYPADYMVAAWGEGYFPYLYQRRPDANFDPAQVGILSWELYREMWGSDGEFVVTGNLTSVEYLDRLGALRVPTLVTVGDHDETDPELASAIQRAIPGSRLAVIPEAGHMTFVDQPALYVRTVREFLLERRASPAGGR